MTYLDGEVEHLWHGSRQNRKYAERHTILNSVKNINDILYKNPDGVFEFSDTAFNAPFIRYFDERKDDDLSVEEKDISKESSKEFVNSIRIGRQNTSISISELTS
jgi:hypothetical protein